MKWVPRARRAPVGPSLALDYCGRGTANSPLHQVPLRGHYTRVSPCIARCPVCGRERDPDDVRRPPLHSWYVEAEACLRECRKCTELEEHHVKTHLEVEYLEVRRVCDMCGKSWHDAHATDMYGFCG